MTRFSGAAALVTVLFSAIIATFPSTVAAQTRLGWQLFGGGTLPISAYVHNGIRVDSEGLSDTGEEQLLPHLIDQYNSNGIQVGMGFLVDSFELRYVFHHFGWDKAVTICTGSSAAPQLPTGEIDDAAVVYDCVEDYLSERGSVEGSGLDPVILHVLSAGYRLHLLPLDQPLQPFLVIAPGLALSTYTDNQPEDGDSLGFHLSSGVGADLSLTHELTLAIEGRFNLLITSTPGRHQAAVNRAQARGNSAVSALIDTFEYVSIAFGFRLDFH